RRTLVDADEPDVGLHVEHVAGGDAGTGAEIEHRRRWTGADGGRDRFLQTAVARHLLGHHRLVRVRVEVKLRLAHIEGQNDSSKVAAPAGSSSIHQWPRPSSVSMRAPARSPARRAPDSARNGSAVGTTTTPGFGMALNAGPHSSCTVVADR